MQKVLHDDGTPNGNGKAPAAKKKGSRLGLLIRYGEDLEDLNGRLDKEETSPTFREQVKEVTQPSDWYRHSLA